MNSTGPNYPENIFLGIISNIVEQSQQVFFVVQCQFFENKGIGHFVATLTHGK